MVGSSSHMPDIVMLGKLKVTTEKHVPLSVNTILLVSQIWHFPITNISLEYSTPVVLSDKDGKLGQLTWAILVEQISSQ